MDIPTRQDLVILAEEAGEIIFNASRQITRLPDKSDKTPLTEGDLEVHNLVKAFFEHYPEIPLISEESSGEKRVPAEGYCAVLDPIDGTMGLIQGRNCSAFCLAILKDGVPILSVLQDPYLTRTYSAELGKGAWEEGAFDEEETPLRLANIPMVVANTPSVEIVTWYGAEYNLFPALSHLATNPAYRFYKSAGVAFFGGLIASGQLDALLFSGTYIWEIATMGLLVSEAGGIYSDMMGNPIGPDIYREGKMHGLIMARNEQIYREMLELTAYLRR